MFFNLRLETAVGTLRSLKSQQLPERGDELSLKLNGWQTTNRARAMTGDERVRRFRALRRERLRVS